MQWFGKQNPKTNTCVGNFLNEDLKKGCSFGAAYHFYVHMANENFFEGGFHYVFWVKLFFERAFFQLKVRFLYCEQANYLPTNFSPTTWRIFPDILTKDRFDKKTVKNPKIIRSKAKMLALKLKHKAWRRVLQSKLNDSFHLLTFFDFLKVRTISLKIKKQQKSRRTLLKFVWTRKPSNISAMLLAAKKAKNQSSERYARMPAIVLWKLSLCLCFILQLCKWL